MPLITLRITDEQLNYLDSKKTNRSKYVRELIDRELDRQKTEFNIEKIVEEKIREYGVFLEEKKELNNTENKENEEDEKMLNNANEAIEEILSL